MAILPRQNRQIKILNKMKKLELKHLAPYLPYELKLMSRNNEGIYTLKGITTYALQVEESMYGVSYYDVKPILRPLTDLDNIIFTIKEEIDGWCAAYDEWWDYQSSNYTQMMLNCPFEIIQKLFQLHLDVFVLIPKGLAVDVNTL